MDWNVFPREIHDYILRLFCEDIINTYTSLVSRKNMRRRYKYWTKEISLKWPAAPLCLQHISSATRVCRSFYYSIVHDIKIHEEAPMEHLQNLQYETVFKLARIPFPDDEWDNVRTMRVHIGLFMDLAGVFWKNSMVFEDDIIIIEVLWVLQKASVMMLLPHVEKWLYCHGEPWEGGPDLDDYTTINMRYPKVRADVVDDFAVLARGGAGCVSIEYNEYGDFSACTIGGLYRGANYHDTFKDSGLAHAATEDSRQLQILQNRVQLAAYPILHRLDNDEPYSWWVLRLGGQFSGRVFAVNFKHQIFWNQAMGNNVVCYSTDGDSLWDPAEWALVKAARKDGGPSKPLSEIIDKIADSQGANDSKESNEENGTEFNTVSNHSGSHIGDYEVSDHDVEGDDNDSRSGDEGYWDHSHRMIRRLASYRLK